MKSKRTPFDPSRDKVVISSEYFEDDRPSFICSICNQTLIRSTDAGMNNTSFWCRNCSVEFNPEEENVRRESKLSVPDRNIEPAVSSIQHDYHKDVEISRGFCMLISKSSTSVIFRWLRYLLMELI